MQTTNLLELRNSLATRYDEHLARCLRIVAGVANALEPTSRGLIGPRVAFWNSVNGEFKSYSEQLGGDFRPEVRPGGRVLVGIELLFEQGQHDPYYVIPITLDFADESTVAVCVENGRSIAFRTGITPDYGEAAAQVNQATVGRVRERYRLGGQ